MRPFDHAWRVLKHFPDANGVYPPENTPAQPPLDDKNQQAMAMFAQVQAAKRARQQQMIDAGLIPTGPAAGMPQPPPPQVPPAPDLNQMMQQQQPPM